MRNPGQISSFWKTIRTVSSRKIKKQRQRRAEKAEKELKKLEDRREFLQPVMDNVSKEIKEYGMIKTFLPEAEHWNVR